jgi:uncharacterized metal-binding protein
MPNAPAHDLITVVTAIGADVAYVHYSPHPDPMLATLFTAAYLFAGYACAGDLDLNSREYRRWGLLRFLWWPYRNLVPHRSWISHGLIFGGVIRVLYLAVATTLAFWLGLWGYGRLGPHVDASSATESGWNTLLTWVNMHPYLTASALTGFILAGTTHSLADFIYSGLKRRVRAFR